MTTFEIVHNIDAIVSHSITAKNLEDAEKIARAKTDLLISTVGSLFPSLKIGTVYTAIGTMED